MPRLMKKYLTPVLISMVALFLTFPPAAAAENKQTDKKTQKSPQKDQKPPKVAPKPEPEPEPEPEPLRPKVGMFITGLHSFDLRNQSYNVTFWAWFIHSYKDFQPELSTEIVNAHNYEREKPVVQDAANNVKWAQVKLTGKITHQWDIAKYPFDRQVLQIVLEDSELDYSGLQYVADTRNSKVDENVQLADWKITNFDIRAHPITYQTTYGDPDLEEGNSTYGRVTASITIERQGARLFFNMFLALYIAFLLSTLAFFVPIDNTSARLSLATAAIFSAIGNKYMVDSTLPPTTVLTLVDKIQILTFLFIGVSALVTVIYAYLGTKQEELAKRINKYGEVVLPLSYIVLNVYWVYQAVQ